MPVAELFFPSRRFQRLEKKTSLRSILDLNEATGEPRLTTANVFDSEAQIGLLCGNDPADRTDPMGLMGEPPERSQSGAPEANISPEMKNLITKASANSLVESLKAKVCRKLSGFPTTVRKAGRSIGQRFADADDNGGRKGSRQLPGQ